MLIIGIAGGTGSGKTTVTRRVMEMLGNEEVIMIPQDSYYRDNSHLPLEERQKINFDHPRSLEFSLLNDHLDALCRGESVQMPQYSYITCTRNDEYLKVKPARVIIIEGILILSNEELRNRMHIKAYVDADPDDRLSRVIQRDLEERGRDIGEVLSRYYDTVKPSHLQFIEPTKRYADIIIPRGGRNEVAIDMLVSSVEKHLKFY
ncbi:MAG TPA: uridine kinase [Bacteroidales bacterium]|nr:uridine kinase [Bacteroidales bacterium]